MRLLNEIVIRQPNNISAGFSLETFLRAATAEIQTVQISVC